LLVYLREHYGDVASVLGLVVSLVGFLVTILGVRKAERAADEARQAAREGVFRVRSQLLSNEIDASIQFLLGIDRACRGLRWDEAVDRCDDARACLARIIPDERLEVAERKAVESAIAFIGGFLPYIQGIRKSIPQKEISKPKSKDLHDHITSVSRISGRLRSVTME